MTCALFFSLLMCVKNQSTASATKYDRVALCRVRELTQRACAAALFLLVCCVTSS